MAGEKISAFTGYAGSGTAVVSGGVMEVQKYLGMTPVEWQIVGIVGGLIVGFLGFAFNVWLGWRHDQREERGKGPA